MISTQETFSPRVLPICGAVDLGTNTCRLMISRPTDLGDGRISFAPVDSFSRIIRFGEDLDATETLSPQAIDRALIVLEECARRLSLYEVSRFRCVATAACRRAKNASEFVEKVRDRTGLSVEIISSTEESLLAVSGCIDLLDPQIPYGVVFDIGGGSTEVVWIALEQGFRFRVLDCLSLPYGVLSLREGVRTIEEKKDISRAIAFEVNEFAIRNGLYAHVAGNRVQMVGASGTVTTLAAIILDLGRYDRSMVHEARLHAKDLEKVMQHLWVMTRQDRLNHPCIGPQRADFIMGGVSIFQGIYEILNVDPIIVADRGVREGILRTLSEEKTEAVQAYGS